MVNKRFEPIPYDKKAGWWQMTVIHFPNDTKREKRDLLKEIYPTWESAKSAADKLNEEDVEDEKEFSTKKGGEA